MRWSSLRNSVKINGMYYWSTAMRDVQVERTSVEVRFDFDHISVASALIRDRWVKCHCRHMSSLQGYTDRERALASKIWRGRMQTLGVRRAPSEAQLASLLLAAAENEDLLPNIARASTRPGCGDSSLRTA